jgi:hypothetical protein
MTVGSDAAPNIIAAVPMLGRSGEYTTKTLASRYFHGMLKGIYLLRSADFVSTRLLTFRGRVLFFLVHRRSYLPVCPSGRGNQNHLCHRMVKAICPAFFLLDVF